MNSFKKILVIFIFFSLCSAYADNHDKNSELIEQVKEVTENLENNLTEEEDVPLNDPFAGNEGTSGNASINLETGEKSMKLTISDLGGEDYILEIPNLNSEIRKGKTKLIKAKNKLIVSLFKSEEFSWYDLRKE